MASTGKGEYTRVPNDLLEALYSKDQHFTVTQYLVLLYIIRKTYGWNTYGEYISIGSMAKALNKDKANVSRAVSDLEKMGVLSVDKRSGRSGYISINKPQDFDRPAYQ